MPSESEIIIAFIFKRSGKNELAFSEFYLSLSMDLNWFTPKQAKEFINIALKHKLLIKKDDLIKPNFEYNKTPVPVGFYPSKKEVVEKKEKKPVEKPVEEEDVLKEIVRIVIEKTSLKDQEVLYKIHKIEKEKNITPEVAALLVGKEHTVYLDDFFKKIEKKIFT